MASPLILARTFKDAHAFAKNELGLSNGFYRVVTSPATIKACRNVNIYLVPGWEKRPDRFGMKGALRYCRLRIVDVAAEQAKAPEIEPVVPDTSNGDNMIAEGAPDVVGDFFDDVTTTEDAAEPAASDEPEVIVTAGPSAPAPTPEPVEPAEKPKARRRTRCKDCGTLHFKDEPCPEAD